MDKLVAIIYHLLVLKTLPMISLLSPPSAFLMVLMNTYLKDYQKAVVNLRLAKVKSAGRTYVANIYLDITLEMNRISLL